LPTPRNPTSDGSGRKARGTARPPGPREAKKQRVVVTFDDNRMLPRLLGEYDSNLALIEQRLGIQAHAHGNAVILEGSEETCEIARQALESLYRRVVAGEEIAPGDFDGLLRHAKQAGPAAGGPGQIVTRKKTVKARSLNQSHYIDALAADDLVFGIGPAGTGKTYLAVACAAHHLERGNVERIILSRPAVEAGERLGFLPGDMREKVDPYLRPLYDALYDMLDPDAVQRLLERQVVEVAPLAFMRGRTLNSSFIILDEAQNATPEQMKMFLTRIGFGSRVVVTGDTTQVDVPTGKSGLAGLETMLAGIEGLAFVRLSGADVVRHKIVADIVAAYEERGDQAATP
jgi:phosphate starvation-inducible PhoH-like protein